MFFWVLFVKHVVFKMFSKFKFTSDRFCVFYNAPRIIGLWYAKIFARIVIRPSGAQTSVFTVKTLMAMFSGSVLT